jgi:hypothetical protein
MIFVIVVIINRYSFNETSWDEMYDFWGKTGACTRKIFTAVIGVEH